MSGKGKAMHQARSISREAASIFVGTDDLDDLFSAASARRDAAHGSMVTFSKKVFIPLTHLCRDVCHYCTFAKAPSRGSSAYLNRDEVLNIARKGRAAGCREALFTLGDKPELRYDKARRELDHLGHPSTVSYLAEMADLVFQETGLLPHTNPGVLSLDETRLLRTVAVSQGIMLEQTSERLCEKGGPHFGSPDKVPARRLEAIQRAGESGVALTSGLLIGIGETREERLDALFALRQLHERYGHLQEIIIQNFRPKMNTRMANAPAADRGELLWTIALARLIFEPEMNIQAPPNLSRGDLRSLLSAGINDWGGVSPVTPDHVNPEAPWPHLHVLEASTRAAGKALHERFAIYPSYVRQGHRWLDQRFQQPVRALTDADGWPRTDPWFAGALTPIPHDVEKTPSIAVSNGVAVALRKVDRGYQLTEADVVSLFRARDADFTAVCQTANDMRRQINGDVVSYVITRNINYTNICSFKCRFCAFSKGKMGEELRGKPYMLSDREISDRVQEAWRRGATEVCMQGGIHPSYTGQTYLDICGVVKSTSPEIHIHAFSPLEVLQGAHRLGLSVREFLGELKSQGLGTLPGTAAEILDDEVRAELCPDKLTTAEWLAVMRDAHDLGIRSTATIMFGHIDRYEHWARHLLRIRTLQDETGGFTEFVPLPFVHMESPIYLKGRSRRGPSFRECVLMHAVARLTFGRSIPNIQASWVKLGEDGATACLNAGVNDLGGTLMDESISRSAGASHGQEMTPSEMERIIRAAGRVPLQRTTLYQAAPDTVRPVAILCAS
jgi:FO synthase